MTGLRASPMRRRVMRRRVCVSCNTQFLPKRIDAEFCSDRCQKADYRRRDARAKAEALFKTREQIAQNAADQAWMLENHQYWATRQNIDADRCGNKHIRFIGTRKGILAIHAYRENDLPWSVPWKPARWMKELKHDPANPEAGDPGVTEAVVEALMREPLGGSFIQREYEKQCQALLREGLLNGPVKKIALFIEDPDWRNKPPPGGWPSLPTAWANDWDDGDVAQSYDHPGGYDESELLAGGYSIFKP
jgi:hypothetical protein